MCVCVCNAGGATEADPVGGTDAGVAPPQDAYRGLARHRLPTRWRASAACLWIMWIR